MNRDFDKKGQREPSAESLAEIPEPTEEMWATAVRGKHARRDRTRTNVVTIGADLHGPFPNERAVNDALRAVVRAIHESRNATVEPLQGGFVWAERQASADYEETKRTVVIHNDVERFFPTDRAVNDALRLMVQVAEQIEARKQERATHLG